LTVIELRENAQPIEMRLDDAVGRALVASRIVKASPDPFLPGVWRLSADRYVGSAIVTADAGTVRVDGFMFDMAKIFEDCVTVALREQLAADAAGSVKFQAHHHLDEADTVLMKPDLVWYDTARRPLAVADAKYKAEKPDGFPGADLYQLLAYCTVLGLPEGHLVYAKGNAAHADHVVRRVGSRIHQHALDLRRPPDAILAQLAAIAQHCKDNGH
jgi:5-methylcytosine-specific restriction enzyme subunit McrC